MESVRPVINYRQLYNKDKRNDTSQSLKRIEGPPFYFSPASTLSLGMNPLDTLMYLLWLFVKGYHFRQEFAVMIIKNQRSMWSYHPLKTKSI